MNLDRLFDREHGKRDFLWKGGFFYKRNFHKKEELIPTLFCISD